MIETNQYDQNLIKLTKINQGDRKIMAVIKIIAVMKIHLNDEIHYLVSHTDDMRSTYEPN